MEIFKVRERHIRIENLNERIERLRSAMEIGARRMQLAPARSGIRDRLAENMAKLDELERELVDEVARLEMEIQEAERMLEGWPEHYQRIVRLHVPVQEDLQQGVGSELKRASVRRRGACSPPPSVGGCRVHRLTLINKSGRPDGTGRPLSWYEDYDKQTLTARSFELFLGSVSVSKDTFWPSLRDLKPGVMIAEK